MSTSRSSSLVPALFSPLPICARYIDARNSGVLAISTVLSSFILTNRGNLTLNPREGDTKPSAAAETGLRVMLKQS
jgi:hypothetical protein